ncbi:MAG TPA: hypothetical protein VJA86_01965, partial [Candidatus Nanoarchaeia archaeon]|nr:hypothetical protein [Candidatus Nanoarchaeia archaeon]
LIGGYDKKSSEKDAGKESKPGKKDSWWPARESFIEEAHLRPFAEEKAKDMAFKLFDVYKKAHGMASHPDPFEYWNK